MPDQTLTFRRFSDEQLATDFCTKLNELNIPFEVEDSRNFYDASYAFNPLNREIAVKMAPENFEAAEKALDQYYQSMLDNVDKDYYLFEFSDQELTEIILKPDEWGNLDYQLAQKLLKERGKEVKPEVLELIRKQRNDDLATPDASNNFVVIAGYISAFLGGFFGILVGWHLSYSKKTLPDGRRSFRYRDVDRDHGTRILLISSLSLVFWMFIRYLFIV